MDAARHIDLIQYMRQALALQRQTNFSIFRTHIRPAQMTRLHALLAAALLLPTAPVQAHDFWIEPDAFRPPAGAQVRLTLRVGQHFSGESRPYVPQFFERFVYTGPQGERPVAGELGDDP